MRAVTMMERGREKGRGEREKERGWESRAEITILSKLITLPLIKNPPINIRRVSVADRARFDCRVREVVSAYLSTYVGAWLRA